ncbi:hypothetical protein C1H46_038311 [Malus baccata]|uniref:Uncharacterized protein n=1 Tax=Malus baccata TaxID=106549 RepID=A0A540KPP0_MALBA|nr:hypothetical protein C1H46_038311 [Malus baccata]
MESDSSMAIPLVYRPDECFGVEGVLVDEVRRLPRSLPTRSRNRPMVLLTILLAAVTEFSFGTEEGPTWLMNAV